ncbi:MAG TPA: hypothetical protein PKL73_10160 [Polyangiaceae bacterium]|jgi:hypothetical protein|nr:MAG: hypothetical protein BWY17_03988 [Deltaproteobacteria bacterium ADurb.Bin207]HNS97302.1 hypothetical protein [Polyangiaceae bacterium]HNZ23502.1 hypothetical protein [Polyangiaceae bacterium]HOD23035.1 hypothetical protein [Polyangiaceae bacterium]HOE49578.1 hypothetical protein [Polyangiaceae bacterium]
MVSNPEYRKRFVLLSVLVLVAFLPSLMTGFVFDDIPLIVDNPYAQSLVYLKRCFTTDLWDIPSRPDPEQWSLFYRPIISASYLLNWVASGGAAWSFHLVNVLAHLGAVWLAFRTATRWLADVRLGFAAALVFGLHPTRNESVLWVSGRTDVFMALFLLLALELFSSASRRKGSRAVLTWIAGVLALLLALLSKEYAVVFPILVAVDAWVAKDAVYRRRMWGASAGAIVCCAVFLWLRTWLMPLQPPDDPISFFLHAKYVFLSLGRYGSRLVFPWPQAIFVKPIFIENGEVVLPSFDIAVGVVSTLAFGAVLIWSMVRKRDRVPFLLCALALLLPILNIVYSGLNSTTADRYFYFPLFGIVVAGLSFAHPLLDRIQQITRGMLLGGLGIVCIAITWVRTLDFTTENAFWAQEIAVDPDNPLALFALATLAEKQGDRASYRKHLLRAYSPASTKYLLISTPARTYVRLVDDLLHTRPDGAREHLETLLSLLMALTEGRPIQHASAMEGISLEPPIIDQNLAVWLRAARPGLLTQAAFTASRLGRDDLCKTVAARVSDIDVLQFNDRFNLSLALIRAGAYEQASHQMVVSRNLPSTTPYERGEILDRLDATMAAVRQKRVQAAKFDEPDSSILRAEAEFEVGGWLRAARILRLAHQRFPDRPEVWQRYVRALAQCRLDDDAYTVALLHLDPAAAQELLASIRKEMSPRTAQAVPVPLGTRWWEESPLIEP